MANPTYFTSKYGTKINTTGLNQKQLGKVQTMANNKYGTKAQNFAQKIRKAGTPAAPAAPAAPVATQPPAPTQPAVDNANIANPGMPAQQQPNADTTNTLFPSTRMFEPKNYEGSPLYQFQVKEGQKQLGRSLAARGLTNSGFGIEEELNIPLRAAAQDTDRMTRVASENADRLYNIQNNEALRLERQGNNQWDRQYQIAELMSRQSPWDAALKGLGATGDITKDQGQALINYLKDAYTRVGGGGGGGGGGFVPAQIPGAPDYSNIDPTQIGGNYSSNKGWLNLLTQGLNALFPAEKKAA